MSQSKISKIENCKITATVVDVELILSALDVPPDIAEETRTMARIANTQWRGFNAARRQGIEKLQAELAALETNALQLRFFLPSMVTGLLATPEYAKASLAHSPGNTSHALARKLERQAILYDKSKSFTFLLTEQAVTWAVVPGPALAVQIERLIALSRLPNVRIGIVHSGAPLSRGPMNTFTVYDDRLVAVETFTGRIIFQDPRDIAEHREVFARYEAHSAFDNEARGRLQTWAERHCH